MAQCKTVQLCETTNIRRLVWYLCHMNKIIDLTAQKATDSLIISLFDFNFENLKLFLKKLVLHGKQNDNKLYEGGAT